MLKSGEGLGWHVVFSQADINSFSWLVLVCVCVEGGLCVNAQHHSLLDLAQTQVTKGDG